MLVKRVWEIELDGCCEQGWSIHILGINSEKIEEEEDEDDENMIISDTSTDFNTLKKF